MQYAALGGTGLVVSRLSFGAMTFGPVEGFSGAGVDAAGAQALVNAALEAGITLFDTADVYNGGASEELLGRALRGRRDEVVLATKTGNRMSPVPHEGGLSYAHVVRSCEQSLRRLGTEWVDLFQVHLFDPVAPVEETLRALEDLVRRGLVRYAGCSNWPGWATSAAVAHSRAAGTTSLSAVQVYYSLVARDVEHEILPAAQAQGLGVLVWSPLSGGFLSGKYTRERPDGGGGRLASFDFPPLDRERGYDVVDVLVRVAAARGVPPAQVALAWLLARPAVTSLLLGARTPEQLAANLAAADLRLEQGELRALDEVSAPPPQYPGYMLERAWDDLTREVLARRSGVA